MAPLGPPMEFRPYGGYVIIMNKICFGHFALQTAVLTQNRTEFPESWEAWPPWTRYEVPSLWWIVVIISNKICFGHFALQSTDFPQNCTQTPE